jgi:hypothetical protein
MLRTALALLSTVQIGARIKEAFERSLRQAVVIAVALVFLIAAAAFGLLTGYQALVSKYQFSAVEAAGMIAAALLLIGLLVLATVPLFGKRPKRPSGGPLAATGEGVGLVDHGLGKAVREIGPLPLLIIAFFAGLLAGRR